MPHLLKIDGQTLDIEETLRELDRADYEESLADFLRTAWPWIDPAQFVDGWVIDALAEHLEAVVDGQIRKLLINIPPRTLKTKMCSVAFAPWVWAQRYISHTSGPGVKFLYASYGDSLAMEASVDCRRLIESEWYQRLWGARYSLRSDQNTKHNFSTSAGGGRLITSIGGRATGRGGDIIIVDDPNASNDMEKVAAAKPQEVIDWWDGTMPTRLNDQKRSAFIVIQQRLAQNDLTGHIMSKVDAPDWTHLCLPMRHDPSRSIVTSVGWKDPREKEGDLLWPERFGEVEVRNLERSLGKWRAPGQLQQLPSPKGGGIIDTDWWLAWREESYPVFSHIIASLDTAYTEKTENDPSAMTVWGVFAGDTVAHPTRGPNGEPVRTYAELTPKVMLMHAWAERLEIHKLVQKVAKTCKEMKVDKLLIENKASGISVAQEIRRLFNHENWAVQLIDPRGLDKVARLHSVAPLWQGGLIWAPDTTWADSVISEMANFPKGTHDDLTDTASMAVRHLRDLGLLQLAPEIQAEIADEMQHRGRPPAKLYPG